MHVESWNDSGNMASGWWQRWRIGKSCDALWWSCPRRNRVHGWFKKQPSVFVSCFRRWLCEVKRSETWLGMVSNMFYVHPYLGKWSNLTNIFQMGWNHQPELFRWTILYIEFGGDGFFRNTLASVMALSMVPPLFENWKRRVQTEKLHHVKSTRS